MLHKCKSNVNIILYKEINTNNRNQTELNLKSNSPIVYLTTTSIEGSIYIRNHTLDIVAKLVNSYLSYRNDIERRCGRRHGHLVNLWLNCSV